MTGTERLAEAIAAYHSGDLERAESIIQALLSENSGDTEALNAQGIIQLHVGRAQAALDSFFKAADLAPIVGKYQNSIGSARVALRQLDGAIEHFTRAVELEPDNADFWANLATARMYSGNADVAARDFERAIALEPNHYQACQNLADIYSRQNRPRDALSYLERAARHSDHRIESVLHLASTYERLNQLADAEQAMNEVGESDHPWALVLRARLLRRRGDPASGLALLQATEPSPYASLDIDKAENWDIAGNWHHELALCADQAGETEDVFENCLTAKSYWRRADHDRDGTDFLDRVRRIRRTILENAPKEAVRTAQKEGPPIVFFVGFPRSGTTLMEAILEAHPDIASTGEAEILEPLVDENGRPNVDRPPQHYLEGIRSRASMIPSSATILDKLPLNLVFCRAIDQMFPDARLLVALRDPRDVVVSCLMQRFRLNAAMRNFDTLEATVSLYEEVMGLWLESRETLAIPWHEYRYEDLISDQTSTVDGVLEFIGLDRHPTMEGYREIVASQEVATPSYRDVAEPIYNRAVGRWRAYERDMEPVLGRLAPFVEAFGYEN